MVQPVSSPRVHSFERLGRDWAGLRDLLHPGSGLPHDFHLEPLRPHLRRALVNLDLKGHRREIFQRRLAAVKPQDEAQVRADLGISRKRFRDLEDDVVRDLVTSLHECLRFSVGPAVQEAFPSNAEGREREYRRLTAPENTRVLSVEELQLSLADLFEASRRPDSDMRSTVVKPLDATTALWREALEVLGLTDASGRPSVPVTITHEERSNAFPVHDLFPPIDRKARIDASQPFLDEDPTVTTLLETALGRWAAQAFPYRPWRTQLDILNAVLLAEQIRDAARRWGPVPPRPSPLGDSFLALIMGDPAGLGARASLDDALPLLLEPESQQRVLHAPPPLLEKWATRWTLQANHGSVNPDLRAHALRGAVLQAGEASGAPQLPESEKLPRRVLEAIDAVLGRWRPDVERALGRMPLQLAATVHHAREHGPLRLT